MRNKKDKTPLLPTEEEFLQYVPRKGAFEWSETKEGLVVIVVPKFSSSVGKSFCTIIKKDQHFEAHMDVMGSSVWKLIDGKRTVASLLQELMSCFPSVKELDQRLYLFLLQMNSLHYIELYHKKTV